MEQCRNRANVSFLPLLVCFPALYSLYFISFYWFVGFYFSVESPVNPCNLLPTASCSQELGCLATQYKGSSLFILNSLSAVLFGEHQFLYWKRQ